MVCNRFDPANHASARLREAYPSVDPGIGEMLQPNEIAACADLIATLVDKVRNDYADRHARRDAHPKAHGGVTATLAFDDDLPPELTGGVIRPGASYPALVRFSNGSPDPGSADAKGDTRGMAIKLFGVSGDKLFPDPGYPDAQDFVMISSPRFFINSARHYARFFEAVNGGSYVRMAAIPSYLGIRGSLYALGMLRQTIANPLETRYWSVVPSQLGESAARQAVKVSARPMDSAGSRIPADPDHDFLRAAMKRSLAQGPFRMEFLVQRRGDTGLNVEDAISEWSEAQAPFRRVGVLTIDRQDLDTPERNAYTENLSYNPWHSLPAHRPLGVISRTRRVVYQAIADLRHDMNAAAYPSGRHTQGVSSK